MSDKTTEPSSLVVLLRVLVMLVFLVGLPGVAVLKGSFPELADRLAERGREALASVSDQISQARGAEGSADSATGQPAAAYSTPATIQSTTPPTQVRADEQMTPSEIMMSQPGMAAIDTGVSGDGMAQSALFNTPSATGAIGNPAKRDSARQQPGPVVPLDPERAKQLVGDLRRLGATFYRLEEWGDDGQLFRFQCKMSVGGNPHVNRHFEATDADANRAIEHVVEHVRHWRGVAAL